jgi:hypothetical protein
MNKIYELKKIQNQRRKTQVLTHYGNGKLACVKCGFDDIRALSIDHVLGNGAEEKITRSSSLYLYLIKNNFPQGYQTLCMNCQWIKRFDNNEFTNKNPRRTLEEIRDSHRVKALLGESKRPKIINASMIRKFVNRNQGMIFTLDEIKKELNLSKNEYHNLQTSLTRLIKEQRIRRVGRGEYKFLQFVKPIKF